MTNFPCPCCGYLTFSNETPGTYEICPVCYWEDDPVQYEDPEYQGGANDLSLNESKDNFKAFGAADKRYISKVRKPKSDEQP